SPELRQLHPGAKDGPVLVLPVGWEPCWTSAEIAAFATPPADRGAAAGSEAGAAPKAQSAQAADEAAALADEVRNRGWVAFRASTDEGNWDLFRVRPDGSDRRAITHTREFHE